MGATAAVTDHTCTRRPGGPYVNTVRFDPATEGELTAAVGSFLQCGRSHVVHFLAAHPTTVARKDPAYRATLNRGDLNLPDGAPVAWASRLLGHPASRLPGTEGLWAVTGWGTPTGLRHYLFGATAEVLELMGERLRERIPGIRIVGFESPPFREMTEEELAAAAERMRAAGAQAVWVGLGSPKQDVVGERLRELGAAPVILCVGAAFDFVAGVKRRAPAWMRRSGLEWLHRLVSEPGRLWRRYLVGNPRFMAGVVSDLLLTPRQPHPREART